MSLIKEHHHIIDILLVYRSLNISTIIIHFEHKKLRNARANANNRCNPIICKSAEKSVINIRMLLSKQGKGLVARNIEEVPHNHC